MTTTISSRSLSRLIRPRRFICGSSSIVARLIGRKRALAIGPPHNFPPVDSAPSVPSWSIESLGLTGVSREGEVAISRELFDKLAELAHLDADEEDVNRFRKDIGTIIKCVDNIQRSDAAVESSSIYTGAALATEENSKIIRLKAPLRQGDEPATYSQDSVLKNARVTDRGFFVVPKIIEN